MKKIVAYFTLLLIVIGLLVTQAQAETSYVFAHGFTRNEKQALYYQPDFKLDQNDDPDKRWLIQNAIALPFEDAAPKPGKHIKERSSLGQENEIEALRKAVNSVPKKNNIVLFGISRGASTAINYMALAKPTDHPVAALVVESPFDTVQTVMGAKITSFLAKFRVYMAVQIALGITPSFAQLQLFNSLAWFGHQVIMPWVIAYKHNPNGITPITEVEKLPKDLPILLICSEEDILIPAYATINLYRRLCETGHPNAHILIVKQGAHAKVFHEAKETSGNEMLYVTHAFYKNYGLPYNKEWADLGKELFVKTQPNIFNPRLNSN